GSEMRHDASRSCRFRPGGSSEISAVRVRRIALQKATESERLSENCACANRAAAANVRASNVAPVELGLHQGMIGGQYFAGSFLENELAQCLRTILDSNQLESLKAYKVEMSHSFNF